MNDSYYALGGGQNPTLAKSKDLKNWEFPGELLHPDFPKDLDVAKGEDISCANLFKTGDKRMLLCISHKLGARHPQTRTNILCGIEREPFSALFQPRRSDFPAWSVTYLYPLDYN